MKKDRTMNIFWMLVAGLTTGQLVAMFGNGLYFLLWFIFATSYHWMGLSGWFFGLL